MAASKRGYGLLALLLAALAILPPAGRSDGGTTAAPSGLVAAASAAASATGHRLELHLHETSAPAWPGAHSAGWAVTGQSGAAAPPQGVATAATAGPRHATAVAVLAIRGRAPPPPAGVSES
jgi:hypothetical protein